MAFRRPSKRTKRIPRLLKKGSARSKVGPGPAARPAPKEEEEPDRPFRMPTLAEIGARLPDIAESTRGHTRLLDGLVAKLRDVGGSAEERQKIVETPLGPITLPAMLKMPHGTGTVCVFSHPGAWNEDDLNRLVHWTAHVRARFVDKVEILVANDQPETDEIVQRVDEIVANTPISILCALARGGFGPDPARNAEALRGACATLLGFTPGYDHGGLSKLDGFLREAGPIEPDFYYRQLLLGLVGAFVGETILRLHGGSWEEPTTARGSWWRSLGLKPLPSSPWLPRSFELMPRIEQVLDRGEGGLAAILDGVEQDASLAGDEPVDAAALKPSAKERVYGVLYYLAACDGEIHPAEKAVLDAFAEKLALTAAETTAIAGRVTKGQLSLGKSTGERQLLMNAMVEMVMADGVVADIERDRVGRIVGKVGIKPEEMTPALRGLLQPPPA